MRHNQNLKTRAMITDEVIPRLENGGIALCHICQRQLWFAGSFLGMVADDLKRMAKYPARRQPRP